MKKVKKILFFLAVISFLGISIFNFSSLNETVDLGLNEEASRFNKINTVATNTIEDKKLIPLGGNFGIKIYTDGVIVSSLQEIITENGTFCPAEKLV